MADQRIQCPHCHKPLAFADLFAKSFEKKVCAQYCQIIQEKDKRIKELEKELAKNQPRDVVCCPSTDTSQKPKINCWEFKKCGREPGGARVHELGVCPAAICDNADGINSGKKGGRACWAIAGTFCGGKKQGTYACKLSTCVSCPFYKQVIEEEGEKYQGTKEILEKMHADMPECTGCPQHPVCEKHSSLSDTTSSST